MDEAAELLQGAIDIHVHTAPDVVARSQTDVEFAQSAATAGMRAIVLKSHRTLTADRAMLAESQVPGVRVLGGLVLNLTASGGFNPAAVESALEFGARIIWMPTQTAAAYLAYQRGSGKRPKYTGEGLHVWAEGGRLKPEIHEIMDLIASADAVLATGHLAPDEILATCHAAHEHGVRRIVVNHVDIPFIDVPLEMQRELTRLGVFMERCAIELQFGVSAAQIAGAIRTLGSASTILATDYGQKENLPPVQGLGCFYSALLSEGISRAEIACMGQDNPALLLGL